MGSMIATLDLRGGTMAMVPLTQPDVFGTTVSGKCSTSVTCIQSESELTKYGRIYVIYCQGDMRRSVPYSEAHHATVNSQWCMRALLF